MPSDPQDSQPGRDAVDLTPLEAAFLALPDVAVVLDAQACVRHWNFGAERVLGVTAAEAVGRPIRRLALPWAWADLEAHAPGLLADQPVQIPVVRLTSPTGAVTEMTLLIMPIAGGRDGCLWHGRVPDSRGPEVPPTAARERLATLGQLLPGIAHEINTPMQFIGDNTSFAANAVAGITTVISAMRVATALAPADAQVAVAAAERAADLSYVMGELPTALAQSREGVERVTCMVAAMRDVANADDGARVPYDLNQAIQCVVTLSRHVWKYVADLNCSLAADLPLTPVVPGHFTHALLGFLIDMAQRIARFQGRDGARGTIVIQTARVPTGVQMVVVGSVPAGTPVSTTAVGVDVDMGIHEGADTDEYARIAAQLGGQIEIVTSINGHRIQLTLPSQSHDIGSQHQVHAQDLP